jgi:hypothetical protein
VQEAIERLRAALKEMDSKLPPEQKGSGDEVYRELRNMMMQLTADLNKLTHKTGLP